MRRNLSVFWIVALVIGSALFAFAPGKPAHALYSYTIDFAASDGGFTAHPQRGQPGAQYSSGSWQSTTVCPDNATCYTNTWITNSSISFTNVTAINVTYSVTGFDEGSNPHINGWGSGWLTLGSLGNVSWSTATITGNATNSVATFTYSSSGATTGLTLLAPYTGSCCGGISQATTTNILITSIEIWADVTPATPTPTPTNTPNATATFYPTITPGPSPTPIPAGVWTYPISAADGRFAMNEAVGNIAGMGFNAEPNAVVAVSNKTLRSDDSPIPVHSISDGSVTAVDPAGPCKDTRTIDSSIAIPAFLGKCYLRGSSSFTIPSVWVFPTITTYNYETTIGLENAFRVTVTTGDGWTIRYLVLNATIEVGMTVSKGCILGDAADTFEDPNNPLKPGGTVALVQVINAGGTLVDPMSSLSAEPSDVQCGSNTDKSTNCKLLTNPTFTSADGANAEGWLSSADSTGSSSVFRSVGGVNLIGSLYQSNLVLDPTHTYVITLIGEGPLPGAQPQSIEVKLGQGSSTVQFTGPRQTQSIAAASYTPTIASTELGSGGQNLYTFALINDGPGVIIDFACVADSADSNPVDTTGCIFLDPNFGESSVWTTGGSAALNPGYAKLSDGDSVAQDITLNPASGGAQSYVITVVGRTESNSDSITVSYVFGSHSGDLSPGMTVAVWDHQTTATFSISTATTNTFAISAAGTGHVDISRACITTADGSTPPGYHNAGLIMAECRVVMYAPVGDLLIDTPNLFLWMWGNILNVWNCQAEPILYGIWTALINIITVFGFFRYWLALTWINAGGWLNGNLTVLANYLNAQILNATGTLQDAIRYQIQGVQIISGGATFWDALVSLFNNIGNTFQSAIGALNTLFSSLRDVILALITDLYNLLTLALTLLGSIVTLILTAIIAWIDMAIGFLGSILQALMLAFTAPAVVPTTLPICDTSASQIPESCLGLFNIDNTVFAAGSLVAPFISLVEGLVALGTLWWGFNRFRAVLSGSTHADYADNQET